MAVWIQTIFLKDMSKYIIQMLICHLQEQVGKEPQKINNHLDVTSLFKYIRRYSRFRQEKMHFQRTANTFSPTIKTRLRFPLTKRLESLVIAPFCVILVGKGAETIPCLPGNLWTRRENPFHCELATLLFMHLFSTLVCVSQHFSSSVLSMLFHRFYSFMCFSLYICILPCMCCTNKRIRNFNICLIVRVSMYFTVWLLLYIRIL